MYEAQKYNKDMIIVSTQLNDWGEQSANDCIALVEYFLENYKHAGCGLFAYEENIMNWIFSKSK